MPNLANRIADLSFVRSLKSAALVHGLNQNWLQIARNPTGATGAIAPNIGSVVALELEKQRGPNDVLPGFFAFNTGTAGLADEGYLPSTVAPFVAKPIATGLPNLTHPDGAGSLATRYAWMQELDAALRTGQPLGKDPADAPDLYRQAKLLVDSPDVNQFLTIRPRTRRATGARRSGTAASSRSRCSRPAAARGSSCSGWAGGTTTPASTRSP